MPTWNELQRKRQEADDRLRAEARRQAEADRQAAAQNPPRPASQCNYEGRLKDVCCPLGTFGCSLNHEDTPTYAERLRAWNARVKAGQNAKHDLQD